MIPVLTTSTGHCLTAKNWLDAGIETASFHLAALLVRPGYPLLYHAGDLKSYTGWAGGSVLNAAFLPDKKNHGYSIRSPYDGRLLKVTLEDILNLVHKLKPDRVLMPYDIDCANTQVWKCLPIATMPFFASGDVAGAQGLCGLYKTQLNAEHINELKHVNALIYTFGHYGLDMIKQLKSIGIDHIESDNPALDGSQGRLYTHSGEINIREQQYADNFSIISAQCNCIVCQQGLTLAYLHHLLAKTPLLAQRFLIQHNAFYATTI